MVVLGLGFGFGVGVGRGGVHCLLVFFFCYVMDERGGKGGRFGFGMGGVEIGVEGVLCM